MDNGTFERKVRLLQYKLDDFYGHRKVPLRQWWDLYSDLKEIKDLLKIIEERHRNKPVNEIVFDRLASLDRRMANIKEKVES